MRIESSFDGGWLIKTFLTSISLRRSDGNATIRSRGGEILLAPINHPYFADEIPRKWLSKRAFVKYAFRIDHTLIDDGAKRRDGIAKDSIRRETCSVSVNDFSSRRSR